MTNKVIEREQVVVNGLDTSVLAGLYDTLEEHPEGGRVTFSSRTRWQTGTRAFTSFNGYRVDGEDLHQEERRFEVLSDEPTELGGSDTTQGPVEALMYAVAGCVTATTAAYATLKGIQLTALEVQIESDVNLHGMFGVNRTTRPGIDDLRIRMKIAGEAAPEKLREIARLGYSFSPVRDSVEKGVPFTASVEIMDG